MLPFHVRHWFRACNAASTAGQPVKRARARDDVCVPLVRTPIYRYSGASDGTPGYSTLAVQVAASQCIALHCIALHCIALHCIALHCIALHCIALHCIALHCIALHYMTLCYVTLRCVTLRYVALHYIVLQYMYYTAKRRATRRSPCRQISSSDGSVCCVGVSSLLRE